MEGKRQGRGVFFREENSYFLRLLNHKLLRKKCKVKKSHMFVLNYCASSRIQRSGLLKDERSNVQNNKHKLTILTKTFHTVPLSLF